MRCPVILLSLKYDPMGRRIEKSSSSGTTIYVYDGDNAVETVNATGGLVARYTQGQNIDEPLGMLLSGTTSYYESDALGTITSLSSSAGALAQTYTYDSFGNTTNSSGSLTNFFRYTGREFDTETNLYYYRARYYDPTVGRFLSEDPLGFEGASVNYYEYVFADPVNLVDPFGLQAEPAPALPEPWLPGWLGGVLNDLSLGGAGLQTDPWGRVYSPSLDPTNLYPLEPPPSPRPPSPPNPAPNPSRDNSVCKKGKRHCTAKCHLLRSKGIDVVGYVYGEGYGNSQPEAATAAKKDAQNKPAPGFRTKHCRTVKCEQR